MEYLIIPADPDMMARERHKAKILKKSAWWKNQMGKGVCCYCQVRCPPRELTLDHNLPLIRGGLTSRKNCGPACRQCNQMKQNHTGEEWMAVLAASV